MYVCMYVYVCMYISLYKYIKAFISTLAHWQMKKGGFIINLAAF